MTAALDTPVAFLVFNRPDCTAKVFETIRQARPARLLVAADGPRPGRPEDVEHCRQVRAIIENGVDWPCEVEKNFAEENMGCRNRVSSAISWVFERVEEAIILEDDCLPDPSFFPYCAELLARFRADTRIMIIGGSNSGFTPPNRDYSYTFFRIPNIWGWATWRRAWAHYDVNMPSWPDFRDRQLIYDALRDPAVAAAWQQILERAWNGENNSWDFQWSYAILQQGGFSVSPSRNLITNIGFNAQATHTKDSTSPFGSLSLESMDFPLKHNPYRVPDIRREMQMLRGVFAPPLSLRIWRKLKRLTKKLA